MRKLADWLLGLVEEARESDKMFAGILIVSGIVGVAIGMMLK